MDSIYTERCNRCNIDVEPILSVSGPHIKAECPKCNNYIKFVSLKDLPDFVLLRKEIWRLSQGDKRLIESCKLLVKFEDGSYIDYWKVYVRLKFILENAGIQY